MKKITLFFLFLSILLCHFPTDGLLRVKDKPFFKTEQEANAYLEAHYKKGCDLYQQRDWKHAATEFEKISFFFPKSSEGKLSYYYFGVCCYEIKEYDLANEAFTNYLKCCAPLDFFNETLHYKFHIAESFKEGQRRHPFTMRYLPRCLKADSLALSIYDEIIMALPNHELAVRSLYAKGHILQSMREFYSGVDNLQTLIRRFPKHELAPKSYLKIAHAYYDQSKYEFQNPDILALAELNLRRFKLDFPRHEDIQEAEKYVAKVKENMAKGLCNIALFYERKKLPRAAIIYYQRSIDQFPDTQIAQFCRKRLHDLGIDYQEEAENTPLSSIEKHQADEKTS